MTIRTKLSSCNPVLSFFRVIEERQKAQGNGLVLLPFNIITSLQVIPPVVQEIGVDSVSVDGLSSNEGIEDEDVSGAVSSSKRKPSGPVGPVVKRRSARVRTVVNGEGDV